MTTLTKIKVEFLRIYLTLKKTPKTEKAGEILKILTKTEPEN